jgi:hypothetical protein
VLEEEPVVDLPVFEPVDEPLPIKLLTVETGITVDPDPTPLVPPIPDPIFEPIPPLKPEFEPNPEAIPITLVPDPRLDPPPNNNDLAV